MQRYHYRTKNNAFFIVNLFLLSNPDHRSDVSNGDAGSPSLLYKLAPSGLSAQAYLTNFGSTIFSFHTITLSPLITAFAQTNFLSAPAIAKYFSLSPSLVVNPLPTLVNEMIILF